MAYINRELALKLLERNSITKHITFSDGVSIYDTIANIPTSDVVPQSEEGAECPTCHGTGRIGTTDWLTKNISKKQLAEEKAKAIAEHEQYIKTEVAREIFEEIDGFIDKNIEEITKAYKSGRANGKTVLCAKYSAFIDAKKYFSELKKKCTEGETDDNKADTKL